MDTVGEAQPRDPSATEYPVLGAGTSGVLSLPDSWCLRVFPDLAGAGSQGICPAWCAVPQTPERIECRKRSFCAQSRIPAPAFSKVSRNRCQTRSKPQPGWTPGEDLRQSMAPILAGLSQVVCGTAHQEGALASIRDWDLRPHPGAMRLRASTGLTQPAKIRNSFSSAASSNNSGRLWTRSSGRGCRCDSGITVRFPSAGAIIRGRPVRPLAGCATLD
jgi:hypothetical protein